VNITLNGLPAEIDPDTTVNRLLAARALPAQGIAIAVNGEVVRAAGWPECVLASGDVVDIVTARQGG
jgi:sulfur carrier protein